MRAAWVIVGLLLVAGGSVWIAQGLNLPFAPGSFMTSQPVWVVIGLLAVAAGVALILRSRGA